MPNKEDLLLGLCAHIEANTEREAEIKRILEDTLNWDYILDKAKKERISCLVYKTLSKLEQVEKIIPQDTLNSLREIYYFTLRENLLVFNDLKKLIPWFNKEKIKTIIFKGPMLLETVYKDLGLRSMVDVDILIRKEDLERVDKLLKGLGYDSYFSIQDFSKISPNPYRNSIMYKNPKAGLKSVHLYWHIINFFPYNIEVFKSIDMSKIWQDALPLALEGVSTNTFSLYHQLIYLCMHGFNHSFSQLILLCDLNELLRLNQEAIDWQRLVKEAISLGLARYLYYGLYVCKKLLDTKIPDFVLEQIRPKKISFFERRFIDSVLEREVLIYGKILACLGMNEGLIKRIHFLKGALFPPKDLFNLINQRDLRNLSIFDYAKRIKVALHATLSVLRSLARPAVCGHKF